MTFRCESCDHELPSTPEPGTPCPRCGAELVPERPLELDATWEAERAAKIAAAERPPLPNKRLGRVILTLTSVVMVAVGIVMVFQRQPSVKGQEDVSERVEITITAPRQVAVKIDGVKAGTTPISIKLKGSRKQPMKIEGNGVVVQITPDRDQVVNLVKLVP